jgi:hypothetical protein
MYLFWVVSAYSAASARDKDFFLSPAALENAELTEKEKIHQKIGQFLAGYIFLGLLCEPCGLCERQWPFSLARFARGRRAHRER